MHQGLRCCASDGVRAGHAVGCRRFDEAETCPSRVGGRRVSGVVRAGGEWVGGVRRDGVGRGGLDDRDRERGGGIGVGGWGGGGGGGVVGVGGGGGGGLGGDCYYCDVDGGGRGAQSVDGVGGAG